MPQQSYTGAMNYDGSRRTTHLAVGDSVPDFELEDQHNTIRRLADGFSRGALALVFYRGDW